MGKGVLVQCVSVKNKKQVYGIPLTVSSVATATGGIGKGKLIECDTK